MAIITNIWGNLLLEIFGAAALPLSVVGTLCCYNREIFLSYFLISMPIICSILSINGYDNILGSIFSTIFDSSQTKIIYPLALAGIWSVYFLECYFKKNQFSWSFLTDLYSRLYNRLIFHIKNIFQFNRRKSADNHLSEQNLRKSIGQKQAKNQIDEQRHSTFDENLSSELKPKENWIKNLFKPKENQNHFDDNFDYKEYNGNSISTKQSSSYDQLQKHRGSDTGRQRYDQSAQIWVSNNNQKPFIQSSAQLPPINILQPPAPPGVIDKKESELVQQKLSRVLRDFHVGGELIGYSVGPVVTLHKLKLLSGIRASRVISLSSDIARCIEAKSARISQIAGRDLLGIEVANTNRRTINIRELFESNSFQNNKLPLLIGLGVGIGGEPEVASLAKMPHLLISGTTGSGKSVCMHSIIMSLLYKNTADDCRMILIDPKMLELSVYNNIPHLLTPVITEYNVAGPALNWAVKEMDNRYRKIAESGVRNLDEYNSLGQEKLPYIVIVIDELADLISAIKGKEGKDFETYLQRLAQKARAAGIHLVVATQRPSVDVVSGVIKANFPTRITFQLASEVDRRVIGEKQSGAEHLIGNGDMLYISPGTPIKRLQGPYISNSEVEKAVSWLANTCEKKEHIILEQQQVNGEYFDQDSDDPLYEEAIKIAKEGRASISNLQRRLKIGFPRAGRIYEKLIENGIIQKENGR